MWGLYQQGAISDTHDHCIIAVKYLVQNVTQAEKGQNKWLTMIIIVGGVLRNYTWN